MDREDKENLEKLNRKQNKENVFEDISEGQLRGMRNNSKFKFWCAAVNGKYTEEYGLLEPDVGGDFSQEHGAEKQWCDLRNKTGERLQIFRAPNTFTLRLMNEEEHGIMELWDNDVKMNVTQDNVLCFKATGVRVPKGNYCISVPRKEFHLTISPLLGDDERG